MTGQVSGQSFSVHSQGERLVLTRDGQRREDIELTDPPKEETAAVPAPICLHAEATEETKAAQHALAEGHPFRWTRDELKQARQLANTISRPW